MVSGRDSSRPEHTLRTTWRVRPPPPRNKPPHWTNGGAMCPNWRQKDVPRARVRAPRAGQSGPALRVPAHHAADQAAWRSSGAGLCGCMAEPSVQQRAARSSAAERACCVPPRGAQRRAARLGGQRACLGQTWRQRRPVAAGRYPLAGPPRARQQAVKQCPGKCEDSGFLQKTSSPQLAAVARPPMSTTRSAAASSEPRSTRATWRMASKSTPAGPAP